MSNQTQESLSGAKLNLDDPRVQKMLVKALDWQFVDDHKSGKQPSSQASSADDGEAKALTVANRAGGLRARRIQPPRPNLPRRVKPGKSRGKNWRDITAGDAAKYAVSAYEMAKSIIRYINVEEKSFIVDGTSSATVITSTPTIVNLSNIAQGTDYQNRDGDSIKPLWLDFRFNAIGNGATTGGMLRLLVVQDKENQGVDPTIGDVLYGLSTPILAPYHPLYKQRFKVLVDRAIAFTNQVGLASSGTSSDYLPERQQPEVFKIRMSGHIRYDSTAGADASNQEGALFLMAVSLDATNGPSIRYSSLLTFTDN